jgi:microcystin-dependent protein
MAEVIRLVKGNEQQETYTKSKVDSLLADKAGKSDILEWLYPVGSIYMSTKSTSPHTLFGGTWAQIKGRFLFAAGSNTANTVTTYGSMSAGTINRSAGEQGGEVTHKLTTTEMPKHAHPIRYGSWGSSGSDTYRTVRLPYNQAQGRIGEDAQGMEEVGGDGAHNNMPPYYVVYMWKRTA